MAVFVNTNVSSLQGQRYLSNVQNSLSTTYNRLSSGLRINSAKDDAAGLQIADRLTSQINGLNQGNRNASDAIALAQTIEGGMDEYSNMLQRVRTLAVQAANGTNTAEDRVALTKEATALAEEMQRISQQTTFGGKRVLNGYDVNDGLYSAPAGADATAPNSIGSITFQVGANKGDTISLDVMSFQTNLLANAAGIDSDDIAIIDDDDGTVDDEAKVGANGLLLFTTEVGTEGVRFALSVQSGAKAAIESIDKMIAVVDSQRGNLGAIQNRLESSIRNQANVSANQADARARIRDTDFAEESANLTQQNIIQQAATSMLMQANMRPQLALSMLG